MRKRGKPRRAIEAPRPEEVQTLSQLLAQLAEVNQRLARSHVLLKTIEPPSDPVGEAAGDQESQSEDEK